MRKRARRRLVGAIVLVGIVVIAVPLVLDHAPRSSSQHVDVQMPADDAPGRPAAGVAEPAQSAAPSAAAAVTPAAGGAEPAAAAPAPAAQEAVPVTQAAPVPSAAPQPAGAPLTAAAPVPVESKTGEAMPAPAAPPPQQAQVPEKIIVHKSEAWAVQVIATDSGAKGREFKQRLTKMRFPVYLEKTPDGAKTRVRVGPYRKKEAAEQARQRLIRLGFDPGKVVRKGE